MAAMVLSSLLLVFLYPWIGFACLAHVNLLVFLYYFTYIDDARSNTNHDLYIFILGRFVLSQFRYTLIRITIKEAGHAL
jgi:hypothetical protein